MEWFHRYPAGAALIKLQPGSIGSGTPGDSPPNEMYRHQCEWMFVKLATHGEQCQAVVGTNPEIYGSAQGNHTPGPNAVR